ncbi:methylglyoxal synthase [Synergistales bacterium]|nr:methylglyoxal synthase [Synergistales bacterium]
MDKIKNIGLVAHDARKDDLLDWVRFNAGRLVKHNIISTGTTGKLVGEMFEEIFNGKDITYNITKLKSGPLGGDQQIGSLITEGKIDILIFLTDPMTTQPHDVDVKALVRLSTVYNIAIACTKSSADFMISSKLFDEEYNPVLPDYESYLKRLGEKNDEPETPEPPEASGD